MEKTKQKTYLIKEEKEPLIKNNIKLEESQYQGLNLIEKKELQGGTGVKYWM